MTLVLRRDEMLVSCYGCYTHAEMMVDSLDIEVWLTAESARKKRRVDSNCPRRELASIFQLTPFHRTKLI